MSRKTVRNKARKAARKKSKNAAFQRLTPALRQELTDQLAQAIEFHEAGYLEQAKNLYQQILQHDPNNTGALHLLGNIESVAGNYKLAEELITKAITTNRDIMQCYFDLAMVQLELKKLDQALDTFRECQRLNPEIAEVYINMGNILKEKGQYKDAAKQYRKAVKIDPDMAKAYYNLGVALQDQNNVDECIENFQTALQLDPEIVEAHINLGNALVRKKEFSKAIEQYHAALQQQPELTEIYVNLGNAYKENNQLNTAIECYEKAAAINPGSAECQLNLAAAFQEKGNLLAAAQHYKTAITKYKQTLTTIEDSVGAYLNMGYAYEFIGDIISATDCFNNALTIDPSLNDARFQLACINLRKGKFADGWRDYRHRPSMMGVSDSNVQANENLDGKRVFIRRDQGLGDEIFFLRFIKQLKKHNTWLGYQPSPKIKSLIERVADIDQVIDLEDTLEDSDISLAVGDLPFLLGMSGQEQIPSTLRFNPLEDRLQEMQKRLVSIGAGPYIGLTWRAGTRKKTSLYKEIPIEVLTSFLTEINATFIVLQRNPLAGEIEELSYKLGNDVYDFSEYNESLEDMLALLSLLDDYIGVSNTNMHLCAAVGKTARVLVPHPPEWRWMAECDESPWFPGFKLYRQTVDSVWEEVINKLAGDLSRSFR